jgi:hypothetical protein
MINQINTIDPSERLNMILDKINQSGVKSLSNEELIFLKSFSEGREKEVNQIICEEESKTIFLSDCGNFIFKLKSIENIDEIRYINGTITVPDLKLKIKRIKGELKGSIIVFNDQSVAIDFHRGRYDIFEFVGGIEYELDCFIDDLIIKIKEIE